jgi:hypothetical protein
VVSLGGCYCFLVRVNVGFCGDACGGFWWWLVMVMFFPCCMMVHGFFVGLCGSLGGAFWMKVLGRANGGVGGFIPDCFSMVVL